jgi:hypothetical protein
VAGIVSGARRRVETVIARPVARAFTAAVALMAFGNLIVFGYAIEWLRQAPGAFAMHLLWVFVAAVLMQFAAGVAGLLAWSWSR